MKINSLDNYLDYLLPFGVCVAACCLSIVVFIGSIGPELLGSSPGSGGGLGVYVIERAAALNFASIILGVIAAEICNRYAERIVKKIGFLRLWTLLSLATYLIGFLIFVMIPSLRLLHRT